MKADGLSKKISKLKGEKNAVLLAHNYQSEEVQLAADYLGDSLALARRSKELDADLIVFAGVDFMAEMAAILNPEKKVLMPDSSATCPLAEYLPPKAVRDAKKKHPDAEAVLYVNTFAVAKAESDVVCTSANAPQIVNAMEGEEVLFGPDYNLAQFAQRESDKKVIPLPENGYCYVHKMFSPERIRHLKGKYPDAEVLVHSECDPKLQLLADHVLSTSQMMSRASESSAKQFIIGTEVGMVDRLRREFPNKEFVPALDGAICKDMKKHTLKKIHQSLRDEKYLVEVPLNIAERARRATERMLKISSRSDESSESRI